MTQFEKFKSMDIDALAEWLDQNIEFGCSPWSQWFDEKYCQKCTPIMCKYEDSKYEFPCAWCEVESFCRSFPETANVPSGKEIAWMWLRSKVEE